MKSNFIHLHTHSHYSLLDGLAKIDQLVKKAKNLNMPALALTDHGVMYGAIEFYQKCKQAEIKPIIGCEVYIAPRGMLDKQPKIDTRPYHLVLLAKNMIGYKNLIQVVTQSHLKGYYYKPRVDKELLKKHSEGLIALTACLHGEIPRLILAGNMERVNKTIEFYKNLYGKDSFYLELQYHPELEEQNKVNKEMIRLGKETNTPIVVTNDIHYLNIEDREAHEVLLAVQTGKDYDDKSRLSMKKTNLAMLTPDEMKKKFSEIPEALENTKKIANLCNLEIELGKPILPEFKTPNNQRSMDYLEELTRVGFIKKYSKDNKEARNRLDFELSIIEKTGFADYFLIVLDIINWAKEQGIIVGPGRGSVGGSIVSYSLGITDLNPIKYGLLFERFLNPERISMPDIDIDFADDRRDEVIRYVQKKYGTDHVAQIITFGTMAARGSIRDTARALGMSYDQGDKVAKLIPFGFKLDQALDGVSELKQLHTQDQDVKKLIDMARKLEGVARHASTHACGVVIGREPLINYLPLQQASKGETNIVTQYAMGDVEAIGLLKMDFLGLSNLTIMKNTIRILRKTKNITIDISKIPLNDKKTYRLLSQGKTTGVFQLESDGMKRNIKELRPTEFSDIVAMVALYRPGPMELIPDYISGKHGKRKIEYLHPKLEPILKDTYGIAVYQEQVLQIARDIAGFTLGEADILRKAVGKKIKKLLMQQKKKFIEGAIGNGVIKQVAEKLFHFIEPFAAYGFNRAHATGYGMIAYQTAYLKANYPVEFMAALLTSDYGNLDRVAIEISECEKMGIKVMPPDVNQSFVEFGVLQESENITFGLSAIKNVGVKVSENISDERKKKGPYKNLEDFITRLGPEVINKKTIEALTKCGALDSFAERNQLLAGLEQILRFASSTHKQAANGQVSLFEQVSEVKSNLNKLELPKVDEASQKQRLAWEREFLGIYLTEHPLDGIKDLIKDKFATIRDISTGHSSKRVKVAGVIISIQKIITKSNEPMIFAHLEDTTGNIEVLVFPKLLKENSLIWRPDNIIVVEGKINSKDGVAKLLADKVEELNREALETSEQKIYLTLPDGFSKEKMTILKKIILANPGDHLVILKIPAGGIYKEVNTNKKVSEEIKLKLEEIINEVKK